MRPEPELLDQVITLCQRAGEAILDVYAQGASLEVDTKADSSPVTQADMAAHAILEPGLKALLPGVPVLSEEGTLPGFATRRQWQRYWLVDPLDGTKEFIQRNGEFTVNVALIDRGEAILGVVHVPLLDITYTGLKGVGARKLTNNSNAPIHIRRLNDLHTRSEPFTVVASRRHGTDAADQLLQRMSKTVGDVTLKHMGSSLKLCLVAEGAADLYPRLAPTCEWDTAAAQAVVEAAGGSVIDGDLNVLRYNQKESLLNPFFYVVGDREYDWASLLRNEK